MKHISMMSFLNFHSVIDGCWLQFRCIVFEKIFQFNWFSSHQREEHHYVVWILLAFPFVTLLPSIDVPKEKVEANFYPFARVGIHNIHYWRSPYNSKAHKELRSSGIDFQLCQVRARILLQELQQGSTKIERQVQLKSHFIPFHIIWTKFL